MISFNNTVSNLRNLRDAVLLPLNFARGATLNERAVNKAIDNLESKTAATPVRSRANSTSSLAALALEPKRVSTPIIAAPVVQTPALSTAVAEATVAEPGEATRGLVTGLLYKAGNELGAAYGVAKVQLSRLKNFLGACLSSIVAGFKGSPAQAKAAYQTSSAYLSDRSAKLYQGLKVAPDYLSGMKGGLFGKKDADAPVAPTIASTTTPVEVPALDVQEDNKI